MNRRALFRSLIGVPLAASASPTKPTPRILRAHGIWECECGYHVVREEDGSSSCHNPDCQHKGVRIQLPEFEARQLPE